MEIFILDVFPLFSVFELVTVVDQVKDLVALDSWMVFFMLIGIVQSWMRIMEIIDKHSGGCFLFRSSWFMTSMIFIFAIWMLVLTLSFGQRFCTCCCCSCGCCCFR